MTNTSNATITDIQQTGRIQEIPTTALNLDGGTQLRVAVSETAIQRYQTLMETEEGRANFPPILLFEDEAGNLWIADGHHRLFAAIRAEVRSGTKGDAILNAARINSKNGVPFETSDYRKAVKVILTEYPNLSNRTLAEMLSCSEATARRHRNKLQDVASADAPVFRIGKDQKMYAIKPKEKKKTYHELAETEQMPTETSSGVTHDTTNDTIEHNTLETQQPQFRPGSFPTKRYVGETQLKPIPRDRPDILAANLIAFFPEEFVPNTAREIFRMLRNRYGKDMTKTLALEFYEEYGK